MLSFNRTFDATLTIGDAEIPIRVARLTRQQLDEVDEGWDRLVSSPRGSAPRPDEKATTGELDAWTRTELDRLKTWNATVEKDRLVFFEEIITRYITLDEGHIEDTGRPVTDGAGLLAVFHGRKDVLRDLIATVITKNHLTELMRKNSNSPRVSDTSSEVSSPNRGGDRPGSTAAAVDSSTSAASGPATAANTSDEASAGEPSGPIPAVTPKIH